MLGNVMCRLSDVDMLREGRCTPAIGDRFECRTYRQVERLNVTADFIARIDNLEQSDLTVDQRTMSILPIDTWRA